MFENELGKNLDRRSFLRGSALFAGAIGLSIVPALAQQQPQQPEKPEKKEEPKDPFDNGEKKDGEKKLIDQEGREYRICPQCGYNMYKQGRMWVCDNCGYSYVE
jgi:ribosomal protein S27AE